jgi:beta-fructofuranosidase
MKSYRLSLLLLTISIGTTFAAAPQSAPKPPPLFSVGEFVRIYDPSVGEKEPWYVNDHCFIQGPDGKWHLFGITRQEPAQPAEEDNFAHAVSPELYNPDGWVKQPFALSTDSAGGEAHLWAPYVIEHEGLYYMYYCAGGRTSHEYQIKLATSKDLYTWQRHPANPMMIDGFDARDPFILRIKDKWVMYYTATSDPKGGNHIVCSIESDDLIHWGNKKTVFTDPEVGTWGGPTESPFVVQRAAAIIICPSDHGTAIAVPVSIAARTHSTGRLRRKSDESIPTQQNFIRDKDGRWFVSHCGWGQGGVFLAPLIWTDGVEGDDVVPPPSTDANAKQTIRLPMSVYRDKLIAGWLGQIAGVAWGAPVEFKYLAQIMPENEIPNGKPK